MPLINDYRKGWALRYLREAKAELIAAQKIPYMASSLILEAVKKAQAAVYYSLGDPASVEAIVYQTIVKKQSLEDPVLRCLVEIERMVQQIAMAPELDHEKALEKADELIHISTEIVKLFVGEKVD
jgi:hypothetical protein